MKFKLLIPLLIYSTFAFGESTIFLFNGNSPYSDPSKDFFDDLYKGANGLNGVDNKVIFFPEQYENSLEYFVTGEVNKKTIFSTINPLLGTDGGVSLGGGFDLDLGFDFDLGFDLPELTEEEKQRIDARNDLDYIFEMKHDAFASEDSLSSQVDKYIKEENSRGGEFEGDVTFYFTDHGSLRVNRRTGDKVYSFGAGVEDLYIEDMVDYHREVHNSFPDKKIVFIHDHCFSGGMLSSLWKDKDKLEIYPNVCGFASASPDQPSYDGETFMDMLYQIGEFTDPKKIAAVDKNGDGTYSYGEGMDYYQSVLHSGEMVGRAIPFSTKDTFLNAVYDKLNTDSSDVKRNLGGDKCLSEVAGDKVDVSLIHAPVYKILAEGHIAKSEKALNDYLSYLGLKDSSTVFDELTAMLNREEVELKINELKLASMQDDYIVEKEKVIDLIAKRYDIPDEEAFYLTLDDMLDIRILSNPDYFYKQIDELARTHYCDLLEGQGELSQSDFEKVFKPYRHKYKIYERKKNYIDNFSTRMTKYQRVIKEYKNLEGLKGIVQAMDSKDSSEAQWGRKRFNDYLSILECENSPFAEAKSVQKD